MQRRNEKSGVSEWVGVMIYKKQAERGGAERYVDQIL